MKINVEPENMTGDERSELYSKLMTFQCRNCKFRTSYCTNKKSKYYKQIVADFYTCDYFEPKRKKDEPKR
jgi:hypothetical protein